MLQNTTAFMLYYILVPILPTYFNKHYQLEGIAAYLHMAEEMLKEVSKTHKWSDYDVHLWKRTPIDNLPKQKDKYAHSST
jgi:hypothetical protein